MTECISIIEAGKRLGIGQRQAYAAAKSGDIPTIRIGKRILVPLVAFNRMLETCEQPVDGGKSG